MRLLFILIATALGFILLAWLFPFANISGAERADMLYKLLLMFLLLSGAIVGYRGNLKGAMKQGLWWIVIFLGLVTAYSFKPEVISLKNRLVTQLFPYQSVQTDSGMLEFRKSEDGHFYIKADINNVPVLFLVDTGASSIVLAPQDAKRIGFDMNNLAFNQVYQTANGRVMGASVRLAQFRIGSLVQHDIRASVNGAEMDTSLLGMRFLESLKSYKVEGDILLLEVE